MRFLTVFFIWLFSLSLTAQQDAYQPTYRTLKVNGKVHTFKTSQRTTYPYDVNLRTAKGDTLRSDKIFAQNGKPTVLLFWQTTCVPCQYELLHINQKYAAWQKEADFNFYAISTDPAERSPQFLSMVARKKWLFPAYHNYTRSFRSLMPGGLNGLPQTFLLNAKGEIVYHKKKYRIGDEDMLFDEIRFLNAEAK